MKNKEFYDYIKSYVEKYYKVECEKAIACADDAVGKRFIFNQRWDMERTWEYVSFKDEINWVYQPGSDPEWIFAFNRLKHFIALGQAYRLTNDKKYLIAFEQQASSWITTVKKEDKTFEKAWRTIECGIRLDTICKAYEFFEEDLQPEFKTLFFSSVKEHADFILKNSWNSYHLMSNWGVLSNHGLYSAAIIFNRIDWEKEALFRLEREIENEVYDDGTQWEQSPMYHNEVLRDYLDVLLLSKKGTVPLKKVFIDKVYTLSHVNLAWMKTNGCEPMMGDSDDIDLRDVLSCSALVFKKSEFKAVSYSEFEFETAWCLGREGIEEYRYIPSILPKQTEYFLCDSGNCFARNSWSKDSSYLRFHAGTLGAGHGHADQTHISFVLKGKDFLVDAGRYTYVAGSNRYRYKNNFAHNVVVVDNQSLYSEKDSWECFSLDKAINTHTSVKGLDIVFEGGHLGYIDKGVYLNRKCVWLKEFELLFVIDEFYSKEEHEYEQLFHFVEDANLELDNNICRFKNATLYQLSKDKLNLSIEDSCISRHYNKEENNKMLKTCVKATGFSSIISVFDFRATNCDVSLQAVKSNFKGITFSPDSIESVEISDSSRDIVLVCAHKEYATPTDTFLTCGCTGFGQLTYFDKKNGITSIGKRLLF